MQLRMRDATAAKAAPHTSPDSCLRVRRTQVKLAEYNNMKGQLSAVARKAGGSLAVRDISTLVKPSQVIDSENMTTVFVVVGKYAIKDWETSYEKMCSFVVSKGAPGRACGWPVLCCGMHGQHSCSLTSMRVFLCYWLRFVSIAPGLLR